MHFAFEIRRQTKNVILIESFLHEKQFFAWINMKTGRKEERELNKE